MELSTTLKEAVEEKNSIKLHSAFYVIAHENPDFSTGKFMETFEYVKARNIPGFLEPYDGKEFLKGRDWNEEYWVQLMSDLMDNFCEERVQHLVQVGQKLFSKTNEQKSDSKVVLTQSAQVQSIAPRGYVKDRKFRINGDSILHKQKKKASEKNRAFFEKARDFFR